MQGTLMVIKETIRSDQKNKEPQNKRILKRNFKHLTDFSNQVIKIQNHSQIAHWLEYVCIYRCKPAKKQHTNVCISTGFEMQIPVHPIQGIILHISTRGHFFQSREVEMLFLHSKNSLRKFTWDVTAHIVLLALRWLLAVWFLCNRESDFKRVHRRWKIQKRKKNRKNPIHLT